MLAHRYKAWKEAGLSQALDADLPVSTGAVWGLEKSTWSSQCAHPSLYNVSSLPYQCRLCFILPDICTHSL